MMGYAPLCASVGMAPGHDSQTEDFHNTVKGEKQLLQLFSISCNWDIGAQFDQADMFSIISFQQDTYMNYSFSNLAHVICEIAVYICNLNNSVMK